MVGLTLHCDPFLIRRDPNRAGVTPYSKLRDFHVSFIYFHYLLSFPPMPLRQLVLFENAKSWLYCSRPDVGIRMTHRSIRACPARSAGLLRRYGLRQIKSARRISDSAHPSTILCLRWTNEEYA